MEGRFEVPFHFAAEFLVLAVASGALFDALRRARAGSRARALLEAAGFLALSVAQVLHGALLLEADGDSILLVLRGAGFALVAAGFAGGERGTRPAAGAPSSAVPGFFVAGGTGHWALVPALAAAAAAARAVSAVRLHPEVWWFVGAFASLGAAEIAVAAASPGGGAALFAAHTLRLAGALLLARWLWSSFARSVRLRFLASFVSALILVVVVVSLTLNAVIAANLEREELSRLRITGASRVAQLVERGANMQDSADQIASSQAIVQRFETRSSTLPADASALLRGLAQRVDFLLFVDAGGKVLGSAGGSPAARLPRAEEIALAGSDVVNEVLLRGRVVSSADSVATSGAVVVGAAPVRARGRLVGAVALGMKVSRAMQEEVPPGIDITLVSGTEVVATTFEQGTEAVARGLAPLSSRLRLIREQGTPATVTIEVDGARSLAALVPILRADQIPVGLLVFSERATVLLGAQRAISRTLFAVALAAAALAALLSWITGGRVTRPIRSLTGAAESLRAGDLGARATVESEDEVGVLGTSFNEMAGSLSRMTLDLRAAAMAEASVRGRLEAVVQSMGDGLVASDAEGRIVTFNREAERMTGLRADRVAGMPIEDVLRGHAGGIPLGEAALSTASAEAVVERSDGSAVPVLLVSTPLVEEDGTAAGRVVVLRDVSREREAERMKTEFLANVSHELRTPLTPIKGYTDILRRKKVSREKTMRFLDGIWESTERLERVVGILVDFASLEAGRLTPRSEPLDTRALVDRVLARWRERDEDHRFVRRVSAQTPAVYADSKLLERCLDELIDNAVKFSPEGGKIEVLAERAVGRGRRPAIRISVRDHGIGIEEERMADLFKDFQQLDGSETRSYGGLGLGLAYVRRVAEVQQGAVEARSEAGKGSTFTLILPLADRKSGSNRSGGGRARRRSGVA